jgi:hypothetical protein
VYYFKKIQYNRNPELSPSGAPANPSVSVFPLDEKTFLCFPHLALRTPPGIWKGFKRGSGRDSSFGISFVGIVHIGTLEALPAIHILFSHTEMVGLKVD